MQQSMIHSQRFKTLQLQERRVSGQRLAKRAVVQRAELTDGKVERRYIEWHKRQVDRTKWPFNLEPELDMSVFDLSDNFCYIPTEALERLLPTEADIESELDRCRVFIFGTKLKFNLQYRDIDEKEVKMIEKRITMLKAIVKRRYKEMGFSEEDIEKKEENRLKWWKLETQPVVQYDGKPFALQKQQELLKEVAMKRQQTLKDLGIVYPPADKPTVLNGPTADEVAGQQSE